MKTSQTCKKTPLLIVLVLEKYKCKKS